MDILSNVVKGSIMATQEFVKPTVGTGVTLHYPQDSYPYVVTEVSASGKTIKILPLKTVSFATGHEPARYDGPFPVWSHTYTPEEIEALQYTPEEIEAQNYARRFVGGDVSITLRYGKNGWKSGFTVGVARYHRNYSH